MGIENIVSSESLSIAKRIVDEESNEHSTTLKDYWIKLGNQLEIDGVEPQHIAKEASELILDIRAKNTGKPRSELYMGSWFYQVYSAKGWVNKDFDHSSKNEEGAPEPERQNSSIYEQENYDIINLLKDLRGWCNAAITQFKTSAFESLVSAEEMNETKLIVRQAIQHASDNINNKTMIPHAHYHVLFREFITATSGGVSAPYYLHVKKKVEFTPKQVGKIVKAFVRNMPLRYEPQDEDESESCGFSGLQCKNCKNWRTEIQFNDTSDKKQSYCYKCHTSVNAPVPGLVANMINESQW